MVGRLVILLESRSQVVGSCWSLVGTDFNSWEKLGSTKIRVWEWYATYTLRNKMTVTVHLSPSRIKFPKRMLAQ